MKKNVILFLILFYINVVHSQNSNFQAATYNVILGSAIAGVGAVINKEKNEKWTNVFLKGIAKGAFGGLIVYNSKWMIKNMELKDNWTYAWGGKCLNIIGSSVIENASYNKGAFSQFNVSFSFLRVEVRTVKFNIQPKIMPIAFAGFISSAFNADFNYRKSLQTGQVVFTYDEHSKFYQYGLGFVRVNTINVENIYKDDVKLLAHEIIHVFQYNDFIGLNATYYPLFNSSRHEKSLCNKVNKWIYYDMHYIIKQSIYHLEESSSKNQYDNYLEHEAGFYSNEFD